MTRRPLPHTPKKLDIIPGRDPRDEQMIGMILALTSEITILRARLDACERLLVAADIIAPAAIDSFSPDAEAQAAREQLRVRSIAKVLRPLRETAERELAAMTDPDLAETE